MVAAFLGGVAKSLGSSLACYAQEQLLVSWRLGSELQKLKSTVNTINAVLEHAEKKPSGVTSKADQDWLTNLCNAVYDTSDVFDEIVTRAKRKGLMQGNAFARLVKLFCSSSNQLLTSISLAHRVKSKRENLDRICKERKNFCDTSHPMRKVSRRESNLCDNVVGREDEKTRIISMLLDSSLEETLCVITIVRDGGLGKSTLARYVFNDEQVGANFKDLHLWVALPQDITLKGIMKKIVAASGEDLK